MSNEEVEYTRKWAKSVKRATRAAELRSLIAGYDAIVRDRKVDATSRRIARRRARFLRRA